MVITNTMRRLIRNRLRDPKLPKIRQSDIAEHMGFGKSWASKLLSGTLQTIEKDQLRKLESFLGIALEQLGDKGKPVSPLATAIEQMMQEREPVAKIVEALLELESTPNFSTRWIETQDMSKIGQEIIRIAYANEDKPGKVARMVLELLR